MTKGLALKPHGGSGEQDEELIDNHGSHEEQFADVENQVAESVLSGLVIDNSANDSIDYQYTSGDKPLYIQHPSSENDWKNSENHLDENIFVVDDYGKYSEDIDNLPSLEVFSNREPAVQDKLSNALQPLSLPEDTPSLPPLLIKRSWMSMPGQILSLVVLCLAGIYFSHRFHWSLLTGHLNLAGFSLAISLPLFIIPCLAVYIRVLYRINNSFALMDDQILCLYTGVWSLRKHTFEMETGSMLVASISQSPLERLLNVGTVSVGRFSRKMTELDIEGVRNPHKVVRQMKRRIHRARKAA